MRMIAMLAIAACVPAGEPIGATAWTYERTTDVDVFRGGRGGHVALGKHRRLEMLAPDGTLAWQVDLPNSIMEIAVDPDGGAAVAHLPSPTDDSVVTRLEADGTSRWRIDPGFSARTVALDIEDATWMLGVANNEPTAWARYAADGTLLGHGVFPFLLAANGEQPCIALPGGGIAIPDRDHQVTAVDSAGAIQWQLASDGYPLSFAIHDTGEVTVRGGASIRHYDAAHAERWHDDDLGADGRLMTALYDGSVIASTIDGLDESEDVRVLVRYDRDGRPQREAMTGVTTMEPVPAPPRTDFRVYAAAGYQRAAVERRAP